MDDDTTKRTSAPHKKRYVPPPATKNGLLTRKGAIVLQSRREAPRTRKFMVAESAIS